MTRRRIIGGLTVAALAIVLLLFALEQWRAARSARTLAKVSAGQAGAAIESGRDAANTIGNRMATDAGVDQVTQENRDAIQNADGASAPVASAVRDAGLAGLCRRAAYRGDPRCVQPPAAR